MYHAAPACVKQASIAALLRAFGRDTGGGRAAGFDGNGRISKQSLRRGTQDFSSEHPLEMGRVGAHAAVCADRYLREHPFAAERVGGRGGS